MRVTKGHLKRRRLQIPTEDVRPTARRLRETLFEFLNPHIKGARFLDLCAGSGAVGIEALSRGAALATFVEHKPEACAQIQANLRTSGVTARAEVTQMEAADFLRQLDETKTWDIAFFDPPYATDYLPVIEQFGLTAPSLLASDGLLVAALQKPASERRQFLCESLALVLHALAAG